MRVASEDESATPLLSPKQERELSHQIEVGVLASAALHGGPVPAGATAVELEQLHAEGEAARVRFTEANLGLAHMVSRQFASRSGVNEADIFQEACLGLMVAIARFDHRRGFRFATYGLIWIRAYAGAATAGMLGDLNLPASRATQLRTVRAVESALSQTLGRPATNRDVAGAVGRSEAWVTDLLAHVPPTSLAALDSDRASWAESKESRPAVEVGELLQELGPLERTVLELRLGFVTGEPLSYAAVAGRLHLGLSRTRRIAHEALEQLRAMCPYDAAS